MNRRTFLAISIVLMIVALLMTLSYNFWTDTVQITHWARTFDHCLYHGELRNFARYLTEQKSASNYHFLINAFIGVWFIPYLIVCHLTGLAPSDLSDMMWLKLLIWVLLLLCLLLGSKILQQLHTEQSLSYLILLLCISSFITLDGSIIMGQIDIIGFTFTLAGFYLLLRQKYLSASICFGFAFLSKGIMAIVTVPLLLAFLYNRRHQKSEEDADIRTEDPQYISLKNLLSLIVGACVILLLSYVLEHRIILGYAAMSATLSQSYDFMGILTACRIGSIPVILPAEGLLAIVYILTLLRHKMSPSGTVWFAYGAFILFMIFTDYHPQWIIYLTPLLLWLLFAEVPFLLAGILYFLANVTLFAHCLMETPGIVNPADLMTDALLPHLTGRIGPDLYQHLIRLPMGNSLTAFFRILSSVILCMIWCISGYSIFKKRSRNTDSARLPARRSVLNMVLLQLIPLALYIIVSWM